MEKMHGAFIFKGFYPNQRIIKALLMSNAMRQMESSRAYGVKIEDYYSRWHGEKFGSLTRQGKKWERALTGMSGTSSAKSKKTFRTSNASIISAKIADAYLPSATPKEKAEGRRLSQAYGIPTAYDRKVAQRYKYGIYTVFARFIRPVGSYLVFTKTAAWAKERIESQAKKRVATIEAGGGAGITPLLISR